jgi:iron(III) transport system ATP-binding protein
LTSPAVSVRGISKRFGSHQALDDISLEILAGACVAVLGASGCGKTTLLRIMAGLETPDAGDIWLGSTQVTAAGRNLVAPHERGIGFVFQDLALWPHLRVRQNLEFVLEAQGVPRAGRRPKAEEALRMVRIEASIDRYPFELSGGEQQRVALARSLVGEPRILLLDEPLSSLDFELRSMLRRELARLQRTLQLTTVYVTHDRADAVALADCIVEMRAGRLVSISETRRPGPAWREKRCAVATRAITTRIERRSPWNERGLECPPPSACRCPAPSPSRGRCCPRCRSAAS